MYSYLYLYSLVHTLMVLYSMQRFKFNLNDNYKVYYTIIIDLKKIGYKFELFMFQTYLIYSMNKNCIQYY